MSRLCQWPDGGCNTRVEFFPTGRTKPNGKPVQQVVDAKPHKGIVIERIPTECVDHDDPGHECQLGGYTEIAKVIDVYTDHHATCPKWAAMVERERQARAAS